MLVWENFHLCYRDLGRKNRVLGNRASPASHMNTSIFLQKLTKKRAARRDIGNRASPVDRAHMKRPLVEIFVQFRAENSLQHPLFTYFTETKLCTNGRE